MWHVCHQRFLLLVGVVAALCTPGTVLASAIFQHGHGHGPPWNRTGKLAGIVLDQEGTPIPGATVEIIEISATGMTNEDGGFAFESLPIQPLSIRATADGYYPSNPTLIKVSEVTGLRIEITLILREPVTESVVVTGTRTEHLQVDAPVRTAVVTTHDIRERKAAVNLAETLTATVAGVRVENTCQNCAATGIRLNGLESKYTQILEDGLPTMSSVSMVYALDQIPTEFVESIEVVKGGASALYGPNAVGGVINLIRREPHANSFVVSSGSGWQYGRPTQSVGFVGQAGKLPGGFAADCYFSGQRHSQIDRDRDGFSDLPRRDSLAGGATVFRRFREGKARLTVGGNVLTDYRRGGDHFDLEPHQTWLTESADTFRSNGFLRWNHTASPSTFYTLASSFSQLKRDTYYGAGFDPNAYGHTKNPLLAADAQVGRQTGRHALMAGFQFLGERVRDHVVAYDRHFDEDFRNTGFYVQDEFQPSNRIALVAGLRIDKSNTLSHPVVSPRGNVRIGLSDRWNVRFGISTGFRAPVIFDEDLHVAAVGGQGFVIENSPDLKEERSLSWTTSLDYVGSFRELPFQVGVNFFSTTLDYVHVLEEAPVPDGGFRKFLRRNAPGSYLRGLELDFNWSLHRRVSVRAGGTFQLARYCVPEPEFSSFRYFRTPSRYGFTAADIVLPKDFSVYTDVEFIGTMLVPHYAGYIPEDRLEQTPSFAVWSVKLGREFCFGSPQDIFAKVRFYAGVDNMFDSYQPDLDRGPLRDSRYMYGPRMMRTLSFGIMASF